MSTTPTAPIEPAYIERLLAAAMAQVMAGKMPSATLDALTRAATVYIELQELSDLDARIEELEAWKATFQRIAPAALSA